MKATHIGSATVTGCLILSLAVAVSGVYGAEPLSKQITKEKQDLDRLKGMIEDQRRKNRAALRRENSILDNLEEIDYQRTLKKKELKVINLQLVERDQEIGKLDRDLESLRREIEAKRDRVRERVRVLYQEDRFSSMNALFSATDYYDFLKRYYYLTWVSNKEGELLEGYRLAVAQMEPKEAALRRARGELLGYRAQITRNLADVQGEKRKKDRLLASVRNEKSVYERSIRELEDSTVRLKGLIQELEKKRSTLPPREPSGEFGQQRGHLDWPTGGRVVSTFGRQKHPKFDTYVYRKGIEIQGGPGSLIRSIYTGTVVYADWFRGYGLLVILDHGDKYFSLYAHADRLMVSSGDRVSARQVIGEIGDTGLAGENTLYFEVRRGSEALNPMSWLKRR